MALFVVDITYSDGSVVRLHHIALFARQVREWFREHRQEYERPGKQIISLLILKADDVTAI